MTGKKILIVDDHKEIVEVLGESFRMRGYQVFEAEDGRAALAKVYQVKPDLILLDVMLPLLDGYEICRTLKNNEETRHIPVILITAKGNQCDIERGFEMQADGYVVKPFRPVELREFAEKVLEKVRATRIRP